MVLLPAISDASMGFLEYGEGCLLVKEASLRRVVSLARLYVIEGLPSMRLS